MTWNDDDGPPTELPRRPPALLEAMAEIAQKPKPKQKPTPKLAEEPVPEPEPVVVPIPKLAFRVNKRALGPKPDRLRRHIAARQKVIGEPGRRSGTTKGEQ